MFFFCYHEGTASKALKFGFEKDLIEAVVVDCVEVVCNTFGEGVTIFGLIGPLTTFFTIVLVTLSILKLESGKFFSKRMGRVVVGGGRPISQ